MKHEIHFATKQLSQSDISWTHQNISLSRRTFEFWKAHRIICCFNNLLKGLSGFLRLWFFKITTNWYSWKIGTREKSPDNRVVQIIKVRIIEVWLYHLYVLSVTYDLENSWKIFNNVCKNISGCKGDAASHIFPEYSKSLREQCKFNLLHVK